MKLAIMTNKPNSHFVRTITSTAKDSGIYTVVLNFHMLNAQIINGCTTLNIEDREIKDYDICLARPLGKPTISNFMFNITVLRILKEKGTEVINSPEAYIAASNKFLTYTILSDNHIPVPDTIVSSDIKKIYESKTYFGENSIIKPICGSRGRGIMYLSDIEVSKIMKTPIISQKFVRGSDRDIRALVVGEEVISTIERVSKGIVTNISKGGRAIRLKPDSEIQDLAIKSSSVLGCQISGVDIAIDTEGKKYILEVNSQPDFMGIQKVTNFRIADRIVTYLKQKLIR